MQPATPLPPAPPNRPSSTTQLEPGQIWTQLTGQQQQALHQALLLVCQALLIPQVAMPEPNND